MRPHLFLCLLKRFNLLTGLPLAMLRSRCGSGDDDPQLCPGQLFGAIDATNEGDGDL